MDIANSASNVDFQDGSLTVYETWSGRKVVSRVLLQNLFSSSSRLRGSSGSSAIHGKFLTTMRFMMMMPILISVIVTNISLQQSS